METLRTEFFFLLVFLNKYCDFPVFIYLFIQQDKLLWDKTSDIRVGFYIIFKL